MDALVTGNDDASASLRRAVLPRRHYAACAGDDWYDCNNVIRLDFSFDDQIDQPRCQHAVGVAITAVARELHPIFDLREHRAIGIGDNSVIEGAIIDKNCRVGRGARIANDRGLSGSPETPQAMIADGIIVVQKGAVLPDRCVSCGAPSGSSRLRQRYYSQATGGPGHIRVVPVGVEFLARP